MGWTTLVYSIAFEPFLAHSTIYDFNKISGTLTWLKMTIRGTLSGKTLIKIQ
jgi:hypothetical protein